MKCVRELNILFFYYHRNYIGSVCEKWFIWRISVFKFGFFLILQENALESLQKSWEKLSSELHYLNKLKCVYVLYIYIYIYIYTNDLPQSYWGKIESNYIYFFLHFFLYFRLVKIYKTLSRLKKAENQWLNFGQFSKQSSHQF